MTEGAVAVTGEEFEMTEGALEMSDTVLEMTDSPLEMSEDKLAMTVRTASRLSFDTFSVTQKLTRPGSTSTAPKTPQT